MAKADDLKARIGLSGSPPERIDSAPPNIPDHEMVRLIGRGTLFEKMEDLSVGRGWRLPAAGF